ncbi:putative F-box domain-containing protein [Helianthus annuus]|uniref:F-box domain-containing protein n=1 Tax=Helianthus annuus TaxID=4232 RepID=A0A9K3IWI0_HELAN|nr:putative F-box domain-containing protein [Helianthus annuus]KAJ0561896.1 putative F-box domain-containing protein [Helianthus annuus]KAJ0574962.1 putative F-box domain-containing protein [Helianthus annuus]KAJ0913596.1 putative F-box domain-containing protein [Helianthus annuus]
MSDYLPIEIQVEILKKIPVKSLIQCRSISKAWKPLIDSSDFIAHYSGQQQHLLTAVLWNISIRKVVAVNVPNVGDYGRYEAVLGFGVCGFGETNDPKIVKITPIVMDCTSSIPWQIDVFTLSTGAWRRPYSTNLPRKLQLFSVRITMDGERRSINLIISFDLTSEEFKEINLPNALAHLQRLHLFMSKLRESLVLIEGYLSNDHVFHVWMMEDGVPKLFTKMFTICTPGAVVLGVLEFR